MPDVPSPIPSTQPMDKIETTPVQMPDTVDYRENPNTGQAGAAADIGLNQAPSTNRENPNPEASHVAPQPNIGERGYTINSVDAPPNRMVPGEKAESLPTPDPDDPSSIGNWDFWSTT